MRNKAALFTLGMLILMGIQLVYVQPAPTTNVVNPRFSVGDTYTFTIGNYDIFVSVNGSASWDTSVVAQPQLMEPFDVTVIDFNQTGEETPFTPSVEQANVTTILDFQNPALIDPSGNFTSLTDGWTNDYLAGAFLTVLFVAFFDPSSFVFNETEIITVSELADVDNGLSNLPFPDQGGPMFNVFLGDNQTFAETTYSDYLAFENDGNFTGSVQDGFTETLFELKDEIDNNRTIDGVNFIKLSWDNTTGLFDFHVTLDQLMNGLYMNSIPYTVHGTTLFHFIGDYTRGIVTYLTSDTTLSVSMDGGSFDFRYAFAVSEGSTVISTTTSGSVTSSSQSNSNTQTSSSDSSTASSSSNSETNSGSNTQTASGSVTDSKSATRSTTESSSESKASISDSDMKSDDSTTPLDENPNASTSSETPSLPVNFANPLIFVLAFVGTRLIIKRRN